MLVQVKTDCGQPGALGVLLKQLVLVSIHFGFWHESMEQAKMTYEWC